MFASFIKTFFVLKSLSSDDIELSSEKAKIKKGYTLLKKELGEEGVVDRAAKEIMNSIIWTL